MTPPGSRIEVVERGERLVLRVPAGGPRAKSLLLFAVLWNLISWVVAGAFWGVAFANGVDWSLKPAGGQNDPVPWFVLPLTGLFPAIGVGLLIWWAKLRFTRTLVFAAPAAGGEPATVAVRTEWFGRETTRTVRPEPGDRAALEVAYEENDRPRHRVRVGPKWGEDRTAVFGEAWTDEEVRWVAAEINRTLGVAEAEDVGLSGPAAPPRTAPAAAEGHADSPHVRADLDARGRAVVEARAWPGWPASKVTMVGFLSAFALAWFAALGFVAAQGLPAGGPGLGAALGLLVLTPFVLVGLGLISVVIFLCRAAVRTTVAEEGLTIRYGAGALRYTHQVPRGRIEIEEVVVWENFGTIRNAGGGRPVPVAAVRVDPPVKLGAHVPLSLGGGREVAEDVAGLVRHRLESAGWRPVPDGL
ncbi:hypothetical protein [Alienimonas sp. DA493]|uniref:hypothetical protein n=1 Tax=Alienimonas sp. DA493 TaxID=3373605 RepID=UPI0037547915